MACWVGALKPILGDESNPQLRRASALFPACFRDGALGLRKVLRCAVRNQVEAPAESRMRRASSLGSLDPHCPGRWWPDVRKGPHGEPRLHERHKSMARTLSNKVPQATAAAPLESRAPALLQRALQLEAACEANRQGGTAQVSPDGSQGQVELVLEQDGCTVWTLQLDDSSTPMTCSQAVLKHLAAEAVLYSIYDPRERMVWDSGSFVHFDQLRADSAEEGAALGDAIFCRMPGPPSVSDRYVVQERLLTWLPGGGFAILMRSPSPRRVDALLAGEPGEGGERAPLLAKDAGTAGAVRATTFMSAYLLRPLPNGDLLVTAMSQTDFGGNIPGWVQAMARKAGKTQFLAWVQRLQAHCADRMAQAAQASHRGGSDTSSTASTSAGSRSRRSSQESPSLDAVERGCLSRGCAFLDSGFTVNVKLYQLLFAALVGYLAVDYWAMHHEARAPG